ncbi:YtxH domain-containing protein [Bacillus sp. V3B]|uniref:YtxH domain-containing protein n=1 Tax=Bacillus sp. V3B TaxID=2804915 RepID=UPI00210CD285|nr:YtxH domain-containing protein [Bacillus sp. V3B]MCQ6274419.1 YtxH domain-containing protein [Bacillus sp. V3B]
MAGNERNYYESNKERENNINAKDFLIGTLVGGIVGSLAALLLAPKSGKELRDDLNNQAYVVREKTDHLRESAMIKGTELTSTVKDKTTAISKKVSEQSADIVKKVKGLKADGDEPIDSTNPVDELFDQSSKSDIQKELEETKKAFDETESKINQ